MSLEEKNAVVLGGTGGVGEGIVKVLLAHGVKVIVPTRSREKGEQLREYLGKDLSKHLIIHVGSVDNEENASQLARYLNKETKHIDIAIASLGGWHQGYPLYSYPIDAWNSILQDNLTSHFLAIKSLVPLLHPRYGCYFHINGFSAEQPYPMAGPVAMSAAAQKSLIQTLAKEVDKTGIRIFELILGPIKTRNRKIEDHEKSHWYFPQEIGEYIVKLVQNETEHRLIHRLLDKEQTPK